MLLEQSLQAEPEILIIEDTLLEVSKQASLRFTCLCQPKAQSQHGLACGHILRV